MTTHAPSLSLAIVPRVAMKLRGAVVRADKKKCPHLEFCCEIRYNVEIESVAYLSICAVFEYKFFSY